MGHDASPNQPQRIGLVGDVHTESLILEPCLEHLVQLDCQLLLCVGDIVDGPEEIEGTERCCELLQHYDVRTICGNHDRWMLEGIMRDLPDAIESYELQAQTVSYLEHLPPTLTFATGEGPLLLCHGIGEDDMAALVPTLAPGALETQTQVALRQVLSESHYRFVVNGHSHHRGMRLLESTLFINVGTLHRDFDRVSAVLDLQSRELHYYALAPNTDPQLLETLPLPPPTVPPSPRYPATNGRES